MHTFVFALVCLACRSHGRPLQFSSTREVVVTVPGKHSRRAMETNGQVNAKVAHDQLRALAKFFLVLYPSSASFSLLTSGAHAGMRCTTFTSNCRSCFGRKSQCGHDPSMRIYHPGKSGHKSTQRKGITSVETDVLRPLRRRKLKRKFPVRKNTEKPKVKRQLAPPPPQPTPRPPPPDKPAGLPFHVQRAVFPDLEVGQLAEEVALKRDTIVLRDGTTGATREVPEARLTAWYSDAGAAFEYSDKVMRPPPGGLTPTLAAVRDALEQKIGVRYDSVLVNYYEHGKVGMFWHRDPLHDGMWEETTSVVSVGAARTFALRCADDFTQRWEYRICNGDTVTMLDGCQQTMQHSVKVEKEADNAGPRISLVFKRLVRP